MNGLECTVEQHFPVAVARLRGVLDPAGLGTVREVLERCLAGQPTALVVDVGGLTAPDDAALGVFAALARRAADWPGAPVLLAGAPAGLREALRRTRVADHLSLCPTLADALAVAALHPVPPRIRATYPPSREAPRQARAEVARACTAWGVEAAASAAQVVVSELVANAVVHAGTPMELSVTLHGATSSAGATLSVSVSDGDIRRLRPRQPERDAEHGRGLLVVDALATSWGTVRTGAGKVVWATVPVPRTGSPATQGL